VRIYLPDDERDAPVVTCSEIPNNPGLSVTRATEVIAGEVVSFHRLPKPGCIEHHPPEATDGFSETFDLVLFSSHEVSEVLVGGEWRKEVGTPTAWKHLDRQSVEFLIGEEV